jgi:hypothetical protein
MVLLAHPAGEAVLDDGNAGVDALADGRLFGDHSGRAFEGGSD